MILSKKRKFAILMLCTLISISLIFSGCGGAKPAEQGAADQPKEVAPVKWMANSVWPANNHQTIALTEYAKQVKEATNGKVEITVQANGALGYKGPELLKVVRDGLVPVSCLMASATAGDEPLFDVTTMPFLLQNFEEFKLFNEIAKPYFSKILEEKWGQKLLLVSPWTPAGLWSKKEVKSVADMKGLKTRTYDKNGALVMQAVGGTPYPLPFSEVYSSLATGVIDSVLTSTPTGVDAKFWEVLKYYSPINITTGIELFTVNLKEFNKLDKESQDAMIKVAQDMEVELWQKIQPMDKEWEGICNKNGITTVPPSQEFLDELSEVTKNIREEWLATAPAEAKEIVAKFNEKAGR